MRYPCNDWPGPVLSQALCSQAVISLLGQMQWPGVSRSTQPLVTLAAEKSVPTLTALLCSPLLEPPGSLFLNIVEST